MITSLKYIMLRTFVHGQTQRKKNGKAPERLLIVNSRFNAMHFRFSFFLFLPMARTSHLILVRLRPIHSRLLSPVLWMRLGRASVHPRETIVSTFVRSHDICVSHSVTNTDASLRVNMRQASVSIPTCKLCS